MSGAMGAQLGNIGTAEQDAVLRRLGFQGEMGGQQRQFDQDIINQAIQNFALGEEMPFQRLAGFNALLRGYATPTTTTTQYQAQNPMNQLAGTAAQIGGVAQGVGMGKKAGGQIKAFAQGGIANESDSITDVDAIARMAEGLSIKQLQQSMRNKTVPEYIGMPILQNEINNAERMKAAQAQQMAQAQGGQQQPPIGQQLMAKADALQGQGIDTVLTGAGGGMVAFNDGGIAKFQNQGLVAGTPRITKEILEEEERIQKSFLGEDPRIAKMKELLSKQGEESGFDRALRGLQLFTAGTALKEGDASQLEKYTQGEAARRREMAERGAKQAELEGVDYQRRADIYKAAQDKAAKIEAASIAAGKGTDMSRYVDNYIKAERAKGNKAPEDILRLEGNNTYLQLFGAAQQRASAATQQADIAGAKLEQTERQKAVEAIDKAIAPGGIRAQQKEYNKRDREDRLANEKSGAQPGDPNFSNKAEEYRQRLIEDRLRITAEPTAAKPAATSAGAKPSIESVTGAPQGAKIGNLVEGRGYQVLDKNGKVIGYAR
jgi:hypothetical protein